MYIDYRRGEGLPGPSHTSRRTYTPTRLLCAHGADSSRIVIHILWKDGITISLWDGGEQSRRQAVWNLIQLDLPRILTPHARFEKPLRKTSDPPSRLNEILNQALIVYSLLLNENMLPFCSSSNSNGGHAFCRSTVVVVRLPEYEQS